MTDQLPAALREALDAPYVDSFGRPWIMPEAGRPSVPADRARAMAATLRWARLHPAIGRMDDAIAALEQEARDEQGR